MNILALCTGNSARSIFLEAALNQIGLGRVRAYSAGSHPKGQVHPRAIALLTDMGVPTEMLRSKSWDEFAGEDAPDLDLVITVCGAAAAETCPHWPGVPVRCHWGVDDPAAASEAEQATAFQSAWENLEARVEAFLAEPVETMAPTELSRFAARIGRAA